MQIQSRHSPVIWRPKRIGTPIDIDPLRVVGIDQGATDAIVRITTSTICGTGLHILKGDLPTVIPGRILGHESIGVVMRNVRLLQETLINSADGKAVERVLELTGGEGVDVVFGRGRIPATDGRCE